jgi:hypothetical protein
MPITPQTIHAGKNDPRILNDGAREHPAAKSAAANDPPAAAVRFMPRANGDGEFPVNFSMHLFGGIGLRAFRMQQVAGLESQRSHPSQQLRARGHIGGARSSKSALG